MNELYMLIHITYLRASLSFIGECVISSRHYRYMTDSFTYEWVISSFISFICEWVSHSYVNESYHSYVNESYIKTISTLIPYMYIHRGTSHGITHRMPLTRRILQFSTLLLHSPKHDIRIPYMHIHRSTSCGRIRGMPCIRRILQIQTLLLHFSKPHIHPDILHAYTQGYQPWQDPRNAVYTTYSPNSDTLDAFLYHIRIPKYHIRIPDKHTSIYTGISAMAGSTGCSVHDVSCKFWHTWCIFPNIISGFLHAYTQGYLLWLDPRDAVYMKYPTTSDTRHIITTYHNMTHYMHDSHIHIHRGTGCGKTYGMPCISWRFPRRMEIFAIGR